MVKNSKLVKTKRVVVKQPPVKAQRKKRRAAKVKQQRNLRNPAKISQMAMARRAHSYMNATLHGNTPPADPTGAGKFTALLSRSASAFTIPASSTAIISLNWTSASGGVCGFVSINEAGSITTNFLHRTQLATAGSWHSIRPLRATLRLINSSPMLNACGGIYVCCAAVTPILEFDSSTGMQTLTDYEALTNYIVSEPSSYVISGSEARKCQEFVVPVASQVGYHSWTDIDQQASSSPVLPVDDASSIVNANNIDRYFCLMMYITGNTLQQDYRLDAYLQDGLRATLSTPLSSQAQVPPIADPFSVTQLHQALARAGPQLNRMTDDVYAGMSSNHADWALPDPKP